MPLNPDELATLLLPFVTRLAGALLFLLAAWIVAGWARRAVRRGLGSANFDATLTMFFSSMARWTVLVLALLACLGMFGIQTTSFAAVIGAAGLAIGLAFQGTLSNFASGVMLLAFRPFTVGDVVATAGITGKVSEIQLFTTTVDTPDNRRFFVPNSKVFSDTIENLTYHQTRRVEVPVGAEYSASIDDTRAALLQAVGSVEGIHAEPAPQIYLKDLGGSSVDWLVRGWVDTADFHLIRERLVRAVKLELDAANIGIPFPQMDVHLDGKLDR